MAKCSFWDCNLKMRIHKRIIHSGSQSLQSGDKKPLGLKVLYSKKKQAAISPTCMELLFIQLQPNSPPTQLPSFMLTFEASSTHQVATGRRVLVEAQVLTSRCGGRTSATNDSRVQNAAAQLNNWCPAKLFPTLVPNFHLKISKKNNSFGSCLYFLTFFSLVGMRSESPWQLATSWIHLFDWTLNRKKRSWRIANV